jgi:hypothetical protein
MEESAVQPLNASLKQSPARRAAGAASSRTPDFFMPAMPPMALIGAAERACRSLVRWQRVRRQARFDAHLLEDIGRGSQAPNSRKR